MNTKEKLQDLIERAILVAYFRDGDVDTNDGTYATTDTDQMIHLESAIQSLFGLESSEMFKTMNSKLIIQKKFDEIMADLAVDANQIKSTAVMDFVNVIVGAYNANFIDNHPTVYDIYRSAQLHVKDRYGAETENWDDELASESRNDTHEATLNELEKVKKQRDELLKLNEEFAEFAKRQGWTHVLIDNHAKLKEDAL
ncbi:hypothetical protein ACN26P_003358 [Vibrio cholerae]|nr:hypothetical protein [Vibrio cholerae]